MALTELCYAINYSNVIQVWEHGPKCDNVLQLESLCGSDCNKLSHMGLANINMENNVLSSLLYTVKPVLNGHSKIDKTKILMTNGCLMKVESIAECSKGSILQYF